MTGARPMAADAPGDAVESDRLSAHVVINNVADKTYHASLYWDQSLYGAPRNGQVTLNWKY